MEVIFSLYNIDACWLNKTWVTFDHNWDLQVQQVSLVVSQEDSGQCHGGGFHQVGEIVPEHPVPAERG